MYHVSCSLTTHVFLFSTDTVIEVTDSYNRLHRFKNTREVVHLAGTHYSFRNTPSLMSVLNTEADARDAHYETQAALNHYFYHDNTAPFISHRLIQRLTNSNPSPKYVEAVATAFRTGTHEGIGSGMYGDLSATVSAIMLEPEARSIHLDKYPFKGLIKEPLHRVMSTLRGMEVQKADGQPLIKLVNLKNKIGMAPHRQPSVFNFYLAEFQPGGRPGKALMQSPEAMITDMPMNTNMFNALYSFIDFGVNRCSGGLGSDNTPCVSMHLVVLSQLLSLTHLQLVNSSSIHPIPFFFYLVFNREKATSPDLQLGSASNLLGTRLMPTV